MTPEPLAAALADRYRVERELGQGGMATVYLAHDLRHDRKVAIKVLRPELAAIIGAERFLREIKTIATLQHPHILGLIDSGEVQGTAYYVMPFVEGESLRDRLAREKQLPIGDAVRIASEVAAALDYAHRHGVIHRDIKPENILLHDGSALVADFGIALAASNAGSTRMTETGMSLGTPHYMSPEQAMGEREITARSDVYALGCVLYEMLSGDPPFTGSTAQAIVARVMTEAPRPLGTQRRTVPPHVEAAVFTALEKLPADRWASAKEFADSLGGDGTTARRHDGRGVAGRAAELPSGRAASIPARLAVLAPWVLVALLAATALWLAGRGGPADPPMRFPVDLDSAQGVPSTAPVLLTPDGRTIIVHAVVGRRNVLLARPLDRIDATVIPGSEGANRAFLSPDGRWVGFSAGGKLLKLPIEGGTPVALADAGWGGGTWAPDGTIIFTKSYQTGLWQVGAAGGDARELTTPDSSTGELAHWWPQLLPDGRHLVFTAYRVPLDRATIELLDLKTMARRVLVQGGVMGRYVASGHLVFARDRSLLAVPFDLGRREVTGPSVVVVDDVAMNYSDGFAAYDVSSGGTLVTMPSQVAGTRFQVVEVSRRGVERVLLGTPDLYQNPRFSPDGARLSLDLSPPRGATDVWVVDPTRGGRTRVTAEPSSDFGALWTPDGRDLIYMSERPLFELYRRSADGSRASEQLVGGGHDRILGSISADGRLAAFVMSAGTGELWTVTLQGAPVERRYLTNSFYLAHPALSPDGRWMAYDSDESGRVETYIQSFPDPTLTRRQVSSGGGGQPLWTRGGRELVFLRGDSIMAAAVDPGSGSVGAPALLFAGPYESGSTWSEARDYDVTPDGERFLLLKWPSGNQRRQVVVTTHWFEELRARVNGRP
ncbi:MAG: protein kinase [Gemmatimonadota bacterium]|nr:protein kinase [Gemmatimonadota bacterium]